MSAITAKLTRVARQEGLTAVFRGGALHVRDLLRAYRYVSRKPTFESLESLLDDPPHYCGRAIKAFQVRSEILALLRLVHARQVKTMLEIGTANGGTLFLWSRVCAPDATIYSLDLPGGAFGDGYPRWRVPLYRRFALPGQRIELIRADSHRRETLADLRAHLRAPIDFLFIDGDHTLSGATKDYEMYRTLVRPGGLIAFHDIAKHPPESGCEVDQLWARLKREHPGCTHDLIDNPRQGWAGIGVLKVPH